MRVGGGRSIHMTEAHRTKEVVVSKEKPRLRYPNNSLRQQVRDPKDTLSAFTVIKRAHEEEAQK